jgi:hypothetical protein
MRATAVTVWIWFSSLILSSVAGCEAQCTTTWEVSNETLQSAISRAGLARPPVIEQRNGVFCVLASDGRVLAEFEHDRLASSARGHPNIVIDRSEHGSLSKFQQLAKEASMEFAKLRAELVGDTRDGDLNEADANTLEDQLSDLISIFPIKMSSNEDSWIAERFEFTASDNLVYEIQLTIHVTYADSKKVIFRFMTYIDLVQSN